MTHCEVCALTGRGAVVADFVARVEVEGQPGSIGLCELHFDAWQRVQAIREVLGEGCHVAQCRDCEWSRWMYREDDAAHAAADHEITHGHRVYVDPSALDEEVMQ